MLKLRRAKPVTLKVRQVGLRKAVEVPIRFSQKTLLSGIRHYARKLPSRTSLEVQNKIYYDLTNANPEKRADAILNLCEMQSKEAIKPFRMLLGDADYHVRNMAVFAMGLFKVKEAMPNLRMLLRDENQYVREETRWALKQITGKNPRVRMPRRMRGNRRVV